MSDEVIATYRNWPIRQHTDGKLYIKASGIEIYCSDVKDARKEIDKAIKKWNPTKKARKENE